MFDNAIYVSTSLAPDRLQIKFVGNFFYFDVYGQIMPKNLIIDSILPPQMQYASKST